MNGPNDIKIGDFGLVKKIEKMLFNEVPKISDNTHETFGLISDSDDSYNNTFNYCTKLYASPEQISAQSLQSFD